MTKLIPEFAIERTNVSSGSEIDKIKHWFWAMSKSSVSNQHNPLYFRLVQLYDRKIIDEGGFVRCCTLLENYLIRAAIISDKQVYRWSETLLKTFYKSKINDGFLYNSDKDFVKDFVSYISKIDESGDYDFPKDDKILSTVDHDFYSGNVKNYLFPVLDFQTGVTGKKGIIAKHKKWKDYFDKKIFSVEHILPIKGEFWREKCEKCDYKFDGDEYEYKDYTNRLGNLTLLDAGKNTSLSNKCPLCKIKSDEYKDSSVLMSKYLSSVGTTDWGQDQIKQRSRELLNIIIKVWPEI